MTGYTKIELMEHLTRIRDNPRKRKEFDIINQLWGQLSAERAETVRYIEALNLLEKSIAELSGFQETTMASDVTGNTQANVCK